MALRLLFFGTPRFAVPSLSALVQSRHHVVGAISQPDRPRGRGQKIVSEAVKTAALHHAIPVFQPERLKEASFLDMLRDLQPDLGVVAAYGRLLPQALLDLPRLGCINVHASLLPRWRGAAPVHRAILAGDHETGVTIMRVVLALDAGPMLAQVPTAIGPNETSTELEARLAEMGATLVTDVVNRLAEGPIDDVAQDEHHTTYARRIDRGDSQIDWARSAVQIHNHIRGLHPWPLATASLHGRRVLLRRSAVAHTDLVDVTPGTIISIDSGGLAVAARPGVVQLIEVQPEGRRTMSAVDFTNGAHVTVGDRLNGALGQ